MTNEEYAILTGLHSQGFTYIARDLNEYTPGRSKLAAYKIKPEKNTDDGCWINGHPGHGAVLDLDENLFHFATWSLGAHEIKKLIVVDEEEFVSTTKTSEEEDVWEKIIKLYDQKDITWKEARNIYLNESILPVIPQFVADYVYKTKDWSFHELINEDWPKEDSTKVSQWLRFDDEEINAERELMLLTARMKGYTIEEEPLYYAIVKGGELLSVDKYWNLWVENGTLEIGSNKIHPDVIDEYMLKATKEEWNRLGINDTNADFEEVDTNG